MGDVSEKILKFRPVTFNYKIHKGQHKQYGLIAEEVAKVRALYPQQDDEDAA